MSLSEKRKQARLLEPAQERRTLARASDLLTQSDRDVLVRSAEVILSGRDARESDGAVLPRLARMGYLTLSEHAFIVLSRAGWEVVAEEVNRRPAPPIERPLDLKLPADWNSRDPAPVAPAPLPPQTLLARVEWFLLQGWAGLLGLTHSAGGSEASVSARIRELRRLGRRVEKRRLPGKAQVWQYRIVL